MDLIWIYLFCILFNSFESRPNNISNGNEDYQNRSSVYSEGLNEAGKFLKIFNVEADELMKKNGLVNWEYETDLSEENLQKTVEVGLEVSEFFLESSENASLIKTLDLPPQIHRQISLIRRSADPTSDEMRREIKETIGKMTSIYGKGKVRKSKGPKHFTLSDLNDIMKKSHNRKELNWAWQSWRDKVGPPIKPLHSNLVDLLNVGAREHGWIDYGDYVRSDYEMGDDFELSLNRVWEEVKPLYKELHAYVRHKLSKKYNLNKDGCLPANLFGDMFAQNWENIFDLVKPKKESKTFDVTKELKKQKYSVERLFHLSESFFVSLGLEKMPESFWEKSVLVKRKKKEMVCHASAWDVSSTDVRIKMCTKITQSDLTTVHHEMGHIEYFLAYKNQPNTFRAGANPGFHEAIGDTISLSVETPSYLKQVGLLKAETLGKDDTISFLLNQALRRLAPLPYNFLVDKWRWRVYEGNITENAYNREWWKLRVKYQGVEPPVSRPAIAFDAASKYHIGANVPYIAYFVSYILQFQLHRSFCKISSFKGRLHTCSIYKSKEAGKQLKKMLEAGRSKPWPIILKEATGDRDLKADAILEYFEPLHDWLKEQRTLKKYPLGWKEHMSTQVLQKKTKRYEAGQGRSGILKTNSGDVSLSFNIPSLSLNDLIKKNANPKEEPSESHNNTSPDTQSSGQNKTSEHFDLGKLLASGNSLSIKTSETTATNKDGNTEINNKQFDINSDGTKALDKNSSSQSERSNGYNSQSELTPVGALSLLQKAIAEKLTINKKNETRENLPLASTDLPFTSSGKNVPTETASPNNQGKNESSTISSVPLAVQERPHSEFPSTAVALKEPKENPKTAGISPEGKNPLVAAITNDPKPNPLPAGDQIALVPVSLPANLISELNKAFNGSNNSTGLDLSAFKALTNNSKQENQAANTTSLEPENNFDNLNVSPHNSSTVQVEETKSENNASVEGTETSKNNTQLDILTGRFSNKSSPAADSQPEDGNYFSSQTVIPCKRSDRLRCLQGKVITGGASLPSLKTGVDETKQTVSVSPSLLLQTIIEHNAADKSTPDPVVNAVPNTNNGTVEPNEQRSVPTENYNEQIIKALTGANETSQENKSSLLKSPSEIDISKIISVLTGGKSQLSQLNETKNSTVDDENISGLMKLAIPENKKVEGYDSKQTSPMKTNKECSDVAKRGVTLTVNCGDKKRHRGGSLSISPAELVQRLLESKGKNEVNRKTIPSAHVVKTPNGFQLNFDLNTKDKIPTESKVDNPVGRQQHVDVFNTPKGMVVKPKSSFQLLKPSFVPVQNKDNLELGDKA